MIKIEGYLLKIANLEFYYFIKPFIRSINPPPPFLCCCSCAPPASLEIISIKPPPEPPERLPNRSLKFPPGCCEATSAAFPPVIEFKRPSSETPALLGSLALFTKPLITPGIRLEETELASLLPRLCLL